MKPTQTAEFLRLTGKLLGTAGIVAGIAYGFAWYGNGGEFFGEAGADIVTTEFAPTTQQQRFEQSLKDYGFAAPRMYDYDGNTVFFSSKTSRKSPSIAARELQETFKDNGVNERIYNGVPDMTARESETTAEDFNETWNSFSDMQTGSIVPYYWTDSRVRMGGVELKGDPKPIDILEETVETEGENYGDRLKRIRFVEAYREKKTGKTTLTATWSDDNLSMEKFGPNAREGVSMDKVVPACPGCERLRRFAGSGDESAYVENVYVANKSPDELTRFYHQALSKRGWKRASATKLIEEMENLGYKERDPTKFHAYTRGDKFLHVVSYRDRMTGDTKVHVMRQP
ncbi:MAG: hypothetical protein ACQEVA_09920 [Myxococcota bacterium]